MKIDDILNGHSNGIEWLKQNRNTPLPDINAAMKSIDPSRHDVMDEIIRPKKFVKTDKDKDGKFVDVARISFALQKLIIKRAVAFCFGNDVEISSNAKSDIAIKAFNLYKATMDKAKSYSLNRRFSRILFTFGEVAEYWYSTEGGTLGTNKDKKLRVTLFSPKDCRLYPFFDDNDDLIAFSREYTKKDGDETKTYFETWTDEEYKIWDDQGNEIKEKYLKHNLGKIPIIYSHQEQRETEDIDKLVDRLEMSVSNFADTNDYHASPKIIVNGKIKSFAQKGENGGILEVDENVKPYYLSWDSAPQAKQIEFDILLKMIYTISQTPDVSFDNMKSVGAISGTALRTLFTDAHLKVQDHREVLDEHLSRRASVVQTYLEKLEPETKKGFEEITIEQEIIPYMSIDQTTALNTLLSVNGNKPLMSHKQSVIKANLSKNPEEDFEQIVAEETAASFMDVTEPSI
ncbi:MAG: phage portal protein [Bacteroidales bacterium]|nr:phage portal protein [Bacteroidales bacterium]